MMGLFGNSDIERARKLRRIANEGSYNLQEIDKELKEILDSRLPGPRIQATHAWFEVAKQNPELVHNLTDDLYLEGLSGDSYKPSASTAFAIVAKEHPESIPPVVGTLRSLLRDSRSQVRVNASLALAELAKEYPGAVRPIVEDLKHYFDDHNPDIQINLSIILASVSIKYPDDVRPIIENLQPLLKADDSRVKRNVSVMLAGLVDKYPRAVQSVAADLKPLLNHLDTDVRQNALQVCVEIAEKDPDDILPLVDTLESIVKTENQEHDETEKTYAIRSLTAISQEYPQEVEWTQIIKYIDNSQSLARGRQIKPMMNSASGRLEIAKERFTNREYEAAIEAYTGVHELYKQILTSRPFVGDEPVEQQGLADLQSRIESKLYKIESDLVDCHAGLANSCLKEATELLETGEYERAESEFSSILDDIDAVDGSNQFLEEATDRAREGHKKAQLALARTIVKDGQEKFEAGEYYKARERFDTARSVAKAIEYEDPAIDEITSQATSGHKNACLKDVLEGIQRAQELIDDGELERAKKEFEEQGRTISGLEYSSEEIDHLRNAALRGYLSAQTEQSREVIDRGQGEFEDGDFYAARETFKSALGSLHDIRSDATEHDFQEQVSQLDRLIEVCEENVNHARRALVNFEEAASVDIDRVSASPSGMDFEMPDIDMQFSSSRSVDHLRAGVSDELRKELPPHDMLEERYGVGGNADVHKIRLHESNEVFALKIPRWQGTLNTDIIKRFVREANIWERLDEDPNIVDVADWGAKPYPWLMLEFMNDGTLVERIGTIDILDAVSVFESICGAVFYAHREGIVHADLKPANIMFTNTDGCERAKVGDWGLARLLFRHSKDIDELTPEYAAPEQVDQQREVSNPYTDIYQLGVVAYELFTGQNPFGHENKITVVDAVKKETPPPPSEMSNDLPPEVNDVIMKAIRKREEERYDTVVNLRRDLVSAFGRDPEE
ncbi:protein kinase domain-containing protein [Salinigranum halophilum]|uniref:protein kinase domain-containing protein n=1 Tax=Salinigranum halophilum TaxID=2565931 RepID=UPI001375D4CF|nr:protein kinase [Salinigranum halophilum]